MITCLQIPGLRMYEEAMKTVSSQKKTIERLHHQLEKYESVTD